ncbi:hypothetical protein HanIR_Chr02g0066741 [Helianthus annuus]|nr:hypothetical protein HanIR_Chr02g0066741 [Helianthus annuus]
MRHCKKRITSFFYHSLVVCIDKFPISLFTTCRPRAFISRTFFSNSKERRANHRDTERCGHGRQTT